MASWMEHNDGHLYRIRSSPLGVPVIPPSDPQPHDMFAQKYVKRGPWMLRPMFSRSPLSARFTLHFILTSISPVKYDRFREKGPSTEIVSHLNDLIPEDCQDS